MEKKANKFKKMEDYRVMCMCFAHELHVVFDPSKDSNDWLEISIWERGQSGFSLWYRLRVIWKIITTGSPFGDHVVLSKTQTKHLAKYLNKIAKRMKDSEEYVELK